MCLAFLDAGEARGSNPQAPTKKLQVKGPFVAADLLASDGLLG
jgi:hypothetical protein